MPHTIIDATQAHALGISHDTLQLIGKRHEEWQAAMERQCMVTRILFKGVNVFEGVYGQASEDASQLPAFDSIFQVASITKPFIATLLMQLQEEGKIDLGEKVQKYLPDFTGEDKAEILIAHFLSHTSGIVDEELGEGARAYIKNELGIETPNDEDDDDAWEATMKQVREKMGFTADDYPDNKLWNLWRHICMTKLKVTRKPQTFMSYCNTGYGLCKDIIDKVTGRPIDDVLEEYITGPLGMKDTHFHLPKEKYGRVIRRLEGFEGYPWYNNEDSYQSDHGAGGLKSTVNDIMRFIEAFRLGGALDGKRILSRRSVETMTRNHNFMLNPFDSWGLGWNVRSGKIDDLSIMRPATVIDHGGYGGTRIYVDKENEISFAFFSVNTMTNLLIPSYIGNMLYAGLLD